MQEALKNPHYKKIWEKVIMNRHPYAKNLEEALEIELQFYGCHLVNNDATMSIGIICSWNDAGYKYITTEGIDEKKQSMVIHIKDKICQKSLILGRPITLEDILILTKHLDITRYQIGDKTNKASFYKTGLDLYFDWQLTKPLHEQTPESWEKIAKLID